MIYITNTNIIFTTKVKNQPAFVEIVFNNGSNIFPIISLKNTENITKPIINIADVKNTTGCMSNFIRFSRLFVFFSKLIKLLPYYQSTKKLPFIHSIKG